MKLRLLLLLLAAAPLGACAGSAVTGAVGSLTVARLDAVPPVPAELRAPTNGKADSPFQLDVGFVVAERARQSALAVARAKAVQAEAAATVALALGEAPLAAPSAPVLRLARNDEAPTAAPVRRAAPRARVHQAAAEEPVAALLPEAPTPYLSLVRDTVPAETAPTLATPAVTLAPERRVRIAAAKHVRVVRATPPRATAAAPSAQSLARIIKAATPVMTVRRVEKAAVAATPPNSASLITRIRQLLGGWLPALRT